MSSLDKRLHACRDDLADERLRGRVTADRFVTGTRAQVIAPLANVHAKPSRTAMQITQALMGETALVFESTDGWAWCQFDQDDYVGYVDAATLSSVPTKPTHSIAVASTLLFPKPDLKSQPVQHLSFNATFEAVQAAGEYLELATGGFVFAAHCVPVSQMASDAVASAEIFLGAPYLWGGKSAHGLDCSGLVQVALQSTGKKSLRDADMQEQTLGTRIETNSMDHLKRGDLVFWKGHVGIMCDPTTLLHANGHHMMVVKEPLSEAVARIAAKGSDVTSIKRIQ